MRVRAPHDDALPAPAQAPTPAAAPSAAQSPMPAPSLAQTSGTPAREAVSGIQAAAGNRAAQRFVGGGQASAPAAQTSAAPPSFEAGHLMAQSLGGASDATNLAPIGGGAQTASSPQSATPTPPPQAAGGFEWGHMAAGGLGGPAQPENLVSASAQSNNQQAVVEDKVRKKLSA